MKHNEAAPLLPLAVIARVHNDFPTKFGLPRQSGMISKNGVIADLAVVGNMHIGHHPVVITNPGDPFVLRCTGIKSAKLANSIAIANFQARGLTGIFFILRLRPQRSKLKNLVTIFNWVVKKIMNLLALI